MKKHEYPASEEDHFPMRWQESHSQARHHRAENNWKITEKIGGVPFAATSPALGAGSSGLSFLSFWNIRSPSARGTVLKPEHDKTRNLTLHQHGILKSHTEYWGVTRVRVLHG